MFLSKSFISIKNIISLTSKLHHLRQLIFFNKDKWSVLVIRYNINLILFFYLKFLNKKLRHINIILSNQLNQKVVLYMSTKISQFNEK